MPSSAPGVRRPARPPPASENERCPRCDSIHTKFCYYNNYNLAQPRHFCKSCHRYWTLGGTIRNVPMGGASRKKSPSSFRSKRLRRPSPSSGSPPSSTSSSADPVSNPSAPSVDATDDSTTASANDFVSGNFGTLLTEPLPTGFLALGEPFFPGRGGFDLGLGLGVGSVGFEDMGFGMGRMVWPFLGDEEEVNAAIGVGGGAGDGEVDCFAWPELGISSQGKGLQ